MLMAFRTSCSLALLILGETMTGYESFYLYMFTGKHGRAAVVRDDVDFSASRLFISVFTCLRRWLCNTTQIARTDNDCLYITMLYKMCSQSQADMYTAKDQYSFLRIPLPFSSCLTLCKT
jgi:hypothetical protein